MHLNYHIVFLFQFLLELRPFLPQIIVSACICMSVRQLLSSMLGAALLGATRCLCGVTSTRGCTRSSWTTLISFSIVMHSAKYLFEFAYGTIIVAQKCLFSGARHLFREKLYAFRIKYMNRTEAPYSTYHPYLLNLILRLILF